MIPPGLGPVVKVSRVLHKILEPGLHSQVLLSQGPVPQADIVQHTSPVVDILLSMHHTAAASSMALLILGPGLEHHARVPRQLLHDVVLALRNRQPRGPEEFVHKTNRLEREGYSPKPGLLLFQGGAALKNGLLVGFVDQPAFPNIPVPGREHFLSDDQGTPGDQLLLVLHLLPLGDGLHYGDFW